MPERNDMWTGDNDFWAEDEPWQKKTVIFSFLVNGKVVKKITFDMDEFEYNIEPDKTDLLEEFDMWLENDPSFEKRIEILDKEMI